MTETHHPIEILLVEDSENDITLVLYALADYNLTNHIQIARDGEEALRILLAPTNHIPTLVLLDLKLPKVDGLGVLRAMRADPRTRLLPVVVMTSSKQEQDVLEAYNLGVNAYVVKPVDFAQFTEAVRQIRLFWVLLNEAPPAAPH